MRIVRVNAQNVWRLGQIERTTDAPSWVDEAEEFLLGGRAIWHMRRAGTTILAADDGDFVGAGIAYPDPVYQQTSRLGALYVDHRARGRGVGRALFGALLVEVLRSHMYAIWLVHPENAGMLRLSRSHRLLGDEAIAEDGYVQFFAERS
jgi:GNAT superfamily N-acetyltransferase